MQKKSFKNFYYSLFTFIAFLVWTALLCLIDKRPIGPNGSVVGLATLNRFFHQLFGVHLSIYTITDWSGLLPVFTGMGFAILGLVQWIKRKSIKKVDFSLFVLGGFYIVTFLIYMLFNSVIINYRPILINGFLEPSYPSTTTLLTLCFMPTALMQLKSRTKSKTFKKISSVFVYAFSVFMVGGRLICGVHWFSDVVGGALISLTLLYLYKGFISLNPQDL